jgi:hypothetical protein
MRRKLEGMIQSIYGLVLGLSILFLTVLLSGCSPKKAFIPF